MKDMDVCKLIRTNVHTLFDFLIYRTEQATGTNIVGFPSIFNFDMILFRYGTDTGIYLLR